MECLHRTKGRCLRAEIRTTQEQNINGIANPLVDSFQVA